MKRLSAEIRHATVMQPDCKEARLVLLSVCVICKHKVEHAYKAKPSYDEADVLSAARAAFNLAFMECDCDDVERNR